MADFSFERPQPLISALFKVDLHFSSALMFDYFGGIFANIKINYNFDLNILRNSQENKNSNLTVLKQGRVTFLSQIYCLILVSSQ